jgi:hypothetical protein
MAITNMAEAQAAYDQAMASLAAAHAQLNVLAGATPVDWTAYQAALDACNVIQQTAQNASGVFQSAILDTPAVTDLRAKLVADTATMKARTDALTADANALNTLASAATDAGGILTALSHYV